MKRNEITEAKHLKLGDRFYKQSDAKKTVLELVAGKPDKTHNVFAREPHKRYPEPLKRDTKVVFLRHGIIFS
ncbi:hypothetical protein BDD43_3415 [Mucilaginibacter gracilis]|uniref:Uncharacterized protein n=1 Tax=Mucilaginibacter gracilis TaxID=423350 RepID=A0A495J307_9SPHI|nr:hypothetical protein [Mucilaginibacter gracilis]RKR83213.1 hypothetical protein BDD43_3415 [Mucilaginibacter gracilis]